MPSLLSAAANEALLRETGGVTVVKGSQTTYGHPKWAPIQVLEGRGGQGVQTADGRVVIANGTLAGITAEEGLEEGLVVDGVEVIVIGIGQPEGEDDGDMLELLIRRA